MKNTCSKSERCEHRRMRRFYHAASSGVFGFFSPALPEKLPDGMKIYPIITCAVGAALVYWKPIPIWATVIFIAVYLIIVCLYIKGFNLAQAERAAKGAYVPRRKNRPFKGPE